MFNFFGWIFTFEQAILYTMVAAILIISLGLIIDLEEDYQWVKLKIRNGADE